MRLDIYLGHPLSSPRQGGRLPITLPAQQGYWGFLSIKGALDIHPGQEFPLYDHLRAPRWYLPPLAGSPGKCPCACLSPGTPTWLGALLAWVLPKLTLSEVCSS